MTDKTKGAALAVFGGSCWGISGCVGQYLFTRQGMDSAWLVPIRLFLAGLLLCGYYLIRNRALFVSPWRERRNIRDLLVYGLAGVSCCQFTYFLTIQLSSAGMATILQDVSPAIILAVNCILARRRPRAFEIISIVMALAGVFFLTTHGSLTGLALSPAALLSGLVSACCVAIYTLVPGRLQAQFPTAMLQGWSFLMGGTLFLLIFRPWRMGYVPNAAGILGIVVVVLVGNVLAFTCYMQGVKLIGPQRSSLYSFAEPVVAAVISTLVLGSAFTVWDGIGFACVFGMMILLGLTGNRK